ncbi:hypothetical protein C8Q70DRAFT_285869 [Cubamyces menziesii]|uniref:Uncharacterized protein n=1 Tax=Trametes cubensis TaxID=1111947 RepID=A0AAD7XGL3_9APHY|nr:hypothetical protein C8Q70DRAFT_285869 [Cubamyces menziesii]KAJ8501935.1 hypothetical protein ONZ51_g306 [Trametes cubensis]
MALSVRDIGIVPSVERFVSTNYLLRNIIVLVLLVVIALSSSIVIYVLTTHYGHPVTFSSSDPRVGFQGDSGGRHTMDIVSSCATTLITCIYSSVHFDVPRSYAHRLAGWRKFITREYWLELWSKVTFWLLGLFSPEMLVLHAFYEFMLAWRDAKWMRAHGHAEWEITHSFAADMGALALPTEDGHGTTGASEGAGGRLHSGFALHERLLRHHTPGALDCKALGYELADRTKADGLFKIITTLQIIRFSVGTLARWAMHLPVAPLEVITCAYVACTLVYYTLWFYKPYNVTERIVVRVAPTLQRAGRIPPGAEMQVEDSEEPKPQGNLARRLLRWFWEHVCVPPLTEKDRLQGSEVLYQNSPYLTQGSLVAAAASLLVGFAHLACWDVEFPNSNGQALWRWCTLVLIVHPIVVFVIILGAAVVQRGWVTAAMNKMALTLIVVYCIARLVLLILLGHSFQSLPKGVYDTKDVPWLSFIPFIH